MASISLSSMMAISLDVPTIRITPGVVTMGHLTLELSRQNTYPENSGTSISLRRSDHCLCTRYSGKYSSYPLVRRIVETTVSYRGATWTAHQQLVYILRFTGGFLFASLEL